MSHSYALKFLSLSVCNHFPFVCILPALHCYDRSVNIDIISLHHDDSSSCRKPLISSACACMCARGSGGVGVRARLR